MPDLYLEAGRMALGSRLRRLTERLAEDAARLYAAYDVALEPRWFPVFFVLSRTPDLSTTEIAEAVGHSRPSVSQILSDMKRAGLVQSRRRAEDGRATANALTPAGEAMIAPARAQYADVADAMEDLALETSHDLWLALGDVERALDRAGLFDRVMASRDRRIAGGVEIRPFRDDDVAAFEALNTAWISERFELEPKDVEVIENPRASVIEKGGRILMAERGGEAVGTCALIPRDAETVELAKMTVASQARGSGIGAALGRAAIAAAREMRARRIYLETNSALKAAAGLYRKLGFAPVDGPPSPYARCDVQMELKLI